MAELPEVETLRRQLEREVVGKKVKTAEVDDEAVVDRNASEKDFVSRLEGAKLKSLKRRGPYLVFTLDTGELYLVSLGPTGTIHKHATRDAKADATLVTLTFTQGGQLRLVDPKANAKMAVVGADDLGEVFPEIADMGTDVVDKPVSWTEFARLVLARSVKLKTLLTDPTLLAGIGPLYADEILFDAGLRFDRASDTLSIQEVRRLYRSVVEILHDGVKHGGTTLDDGFTDLHGDAGGYTEYLQAYGRDGDACRRCRGVISKAKFAGRNTYFCEGCQV